MADFEVTIGADLGEALGDLKALQDAGKITAKQFKSASKGIERAYQNAAKETKKLRDATRIAGKEGEEVFKVLKEGAEGYGGKVGGSIAAIEKFGKASLAAGGVVGPLGAVAVGAAGAIAGLALVAGTAGAALVGLAKGVVEAAQASAEFARNNEDLVTAEQLADLNELDDTIAAIGTTASATGALLFSEFAEELGAVARLALKGAFIVQDAFGEEGLATRSIREFISNLDLMPLPLTAIASLMKGEVVSGADLTKKAFDDTNDATKDLDSRVEDFIARMGEKRTEDERNRAATKAASDATKEAAKAERERARANRELAAELKEIAKAQDDLASIARQAGSDQLDAIEAVNAAYAEEEKQILDLTFKAQDAAAGKAALDAAEARRLRDIMAIQEKQAEERAGQLKELNALEQDLGQALIESLGEWAQTALSNVAQISGSVTSAIGTFASLRIDALEEEARAEQEAAEKALDAWRNKAIAEADFMLNRGRLSEEEHAKELKRIEKQAAAKEAKNRRLARDEERAARRAFKVQKAAQIIQATIDAARAAVSLIPAFSFLGPGAPAAASGVAAGGLAAQLAVIRSQKPPEFAGGGLVGDRAGSGDHVPIMASKSEGIVSPRGMAALGREGLNQVNSGSPPGMSVLFQMDRRIIATAVVDALGGAQVGATLDARAGIATGQALVYGRG